MCRSVELPEELRAAGGPLGPGDLAWGSRDAALDVAGRLAKGGPLAQAYAAYVARTLDPVTGDPATLAAGTGPVAAALIIEPVRDDRACAGRWSVRGMIERVRDDRAGLDHDYNRAGADRISRRMGLSPWQGPGGGVVGRAMGHGTSN